MFLQKRLPKKNLKKTFKKKKGKKISFPKKKKQTIYSYALACFTKLTLNWYETQHSLLKFHHTSNQICFPPPKKENKQWVNVDTINVTRMAEPNSCAAPLDCANTDAACSLFAAQTSSLCAANGTTFTLNGAPFRDSCRLMCGLCTSTSPCADNWYCNIPK